MAAITFRSSSSLLTPLLQKTRITTRLQAKSFLQKQKSVTRKRPFSHTSFCNYPRKDSQDKDSINTEANEYSKSATDDESARQDDAAFNPDVTNPQQEKDVAGENNEVFPLFLNMNCPVHFSLPHLNRGSLLL